MPEKRIGVFTPQQRSEVLTVVKDYLTKSGLLAQRDGLQTFNEPEPIYVRNDHSATAPAYACMQATGMAVYGGRNYVTVGQPTDTTGGAGLYLFNGIEPIPAGRYGVARDGPMVRVLTNGGTITCGALWGPVVASWSVAPGAGGIISAVGPDDIGVNVMRAFVVFQKPDIDLRVSGLNFQLNYNMGAGWETWATGEECV